MGGGEGVCLHCLRGLAGWMDGWDTLWLSLLRAVDALYSTDLIMDLLFKTTIPCPTCHFLFLVLASTCLSLPSKSNLVVVALSKTIALSTLRRFKIFHPSFAFPPSNCICKAWLIRYMTVLFPFPSLALQLRDEMRFCNVSKRMIF